MGKYTRPTQAKTNIIKLINPNPNKHNLNQSNLNQTSLEEPSLNQSKQPCWSPKRATRTNPFSPRTESLNTLKYSGGEGVSRAKRKLTDEGAFARKLRRNATEAEKRMWYFLRSRRLGHYKFIRQCPIGRYIVDFVCRHKKLIVELDGSQHFDSKYDEQRTRFLEQQGYKVIRFWNNDVFIQTDYVLACIMDALELDC